MTAQKYCRKKNQGINPIFYLKNALEERFLKARVGLDGHFSEWRKVSGGILMDHFTEYLHFLLQDKDGQ